MGHVRSIVTVSVYRPASDQHIVQWSATRSAFAGGKTTVTTLAQGKEPAPVDPDNPLGPVCDALRACLAELELTGGRSTGP